MYAIPIDKQGAAPAATATVSKRNFIDPIHAGITIKMTIGCEWKFATSGVQILNQNHQCAEAAEGLSADGPEDGSEPDFALRATAVSTGRSNGMITPWFRGIILEETTILRIE